MNHRGEYGSKPPDSVLRMFRLLRVWTRIVLLLALLLSGGCTYLGRRGLDFMDQFRFSVGAGTTVGVRGSAAGAVDTGLMVGFSRSWGLRTRCIRQLFLESRSWPIWTSPSAVCRRTATFMS